jgi:hypothetical protein
MFPSADESFARTAFPDLDLGDARLDRRFEAVAQGCLNHPGGSLPDKFHDPADYIGCLRLFNHPAVTHESLLSCHQVAVLDRIERHPGTVLIVHDTTDLDFSGHRTLADDLGQIGNGGGRGFLCHNSIAVEPDSGAIFGFASQILHCRPFVGKGEPVAAKRGRADRESRLWLRALDEIGPAPAGGGWVHVADRGADIFEFLQALADRGERFVIRSTHSRALELPEVEGPPRGPGQGEEGPRLLHDYMRALPSEATWAVEVGATPKRQARTALVCGSSCRVTVKPPHVRKGEFRREGLTLTAVRVWEASPPPGEEPLEWLLLTGEGEADGGALARRVAWLYSRRWVVEDLHKGKKTGAGIEKPQLQDVESLKAAIALLSVVAVALVNLRIAARDEGKAEEPAAKHVPRLWVKVLSIWRHKEERDLSVRAFTLALARLGGHLNRKSDGLPGWITLWRGWERLHTMLEYELSRATCVQQ